MSNLTPIQILDGNLVSRKEDFIASLPKTCSFDTFKRITIIAAIQNPKLLEADRTSLIMSCFSAAKDGLLPDGRESAFVIYKSKVNNNYIDKVQYMPMVAGILKKIRNSGEITMLTAHVIYEKDWFDYSLGDVEHIDHKPVLGTIRGEPIGAYAIAKTKDGEIYREVMSFEEIENIRSRSNGEKSKKNGFKITTPWDSDWGEMARKTVIRRLAKRLPMNSELEQVIRREDEMYAFSNNSPKATSPIDTLNKEIINVNSGVDEVDVSQELEQQANEYWASSTIAVQGSPDVCFEDKNKSFEQKKQESLSNLKEAIKDKTT